MALSKLHGASRYRVDRARKNRNITFRIGRFASGDLKPAVFDRLA